MAKVTLLFVVFVDLLGQGLVFPIFNSLMMEPTGDFLPVATSNADRHIDDGLVIDIFFLAWFLGVVYVAKLSDSIGRRIAMLICLGGALTGYVLTIASLYLNSLWLLVLASQADWERLGRIVLAISALVSPQQHCSTARCVCMI